MLKRILAMLIVCVTLIGIVPMQVFAQNDTDISSTWEAMINDVTNAPVSFDDSVDSSMPTDIDTLGVGDNRFTEKESNDSESLADRIYSDYTVSGSLSYYDMLDFYKFTLNSRSRVNIVFVGSRSSIMAGVWDSYDECLSACQFSYDDGSYTGSISITLTPGTYYICMLDEYRYSGTYMFYIEWTATGSTTTTTKATTTTTQHTHAYGSWIRTTEPGCLTHGEDTRSCSCGSTETRTVDPVGHNWDDGVVSGSEKIFTCSECGETKTENISTISSSTTTYTTASTSSSTITSTTAPSVTTTQSTATSVATTTTRRSNVTPTVTRLAGGSRTETAVKISFASFTSAENIILASGDNYADALAGGSLAHALNAPILLIRNNLLDTATLNEIRRLNPQNIYILGGTLAISENVANSLRQTYAVTRIAGKSRFDTAVAIAKKLQSIKGDPSEVFFAYSHNYPDALAISGIAAIKGCPVLYISADGKLSDSTAAFVTASGTKNATILGGTLAISPNAEGNIKKHGPTNVKRIAGTSRYDTCLEINKAYADILIGDAICIATGMNYPDALAGGVFAAINKAPMVLVGNAVNQSQINYITGRSPYDIYVFGGTGAVPEHIVNSILNKTPTPTTTTTVNKNMHVTLSTYNVTVQPGKSITVYVTVKNPVGNVTITREIGNTDIVSARWGDWDGWTIPITITADDIGTTNVQIYVKGQKSSTLATLQVTVPSPVKINLQTSLPQTFSYYSGSTKSTSVYATEFTYTVEKSSDGYTIKMSMLATKTYDRYGSSGANSCWVSYRLVDSNGIVVKTGDFFKSNVYTGDKFYMEESVYNLLAGTYTLLLNSDR